jgi:murein DD-endopeptidase MepM/ murein hydrolase activator NlpD
VYVLASQCHNQHYNTSAESNLWTESEPVENHPDLHLHGERAVQAEVMPLVNSIRRTILVLCGVTAVTIGAGPTLADAADRFDWPLMPRPRVERTFDNPEKNWLPGHRGVDLAGSTGQAVVAAGPGVVVFAGQVAGKPVVSIDHIGGLRTTYEPVTAVVSAGDRVGLGTVIGTLEPGHEGCAVAACLHWGLRRDRTYLDPLGLIHDRPLRLKPLGR